jgi:aryl-alcohol dehydrogenase-like predicted oxidoreductase
VSGPRQADVVRRALGADVGGVNPFASVQATWNVLEPSVGPALADAHAAGWGVLVKEALANGRLVARAEGEVPAALSEMAAAHGASLDQVALAAALAQPWADVVLSGAVTTSQMRSNIEALSLPLIASDMDRLGAMAETPDAYWRRRASLQWR